MSNPILLTWRGRPNRQYFELSEEKQKKLWEKHAEAVQASGVQMIVSCRSDWSSERYSHFGVELYQDMDSLMKMKDILFSVDWYSWIDSETVLSVPDGPVTPVAPKTGGIFKLFLMRPTQAMYALSPQQREEKLAGLIKTGEQLGVRIIFTSGSFSSERYLSVGLEHYPNIDVLQEYQRCLWEMNWFQYTDADTLLGLQTD